MKKRIYEIDGLEKVELVKDLHGFMNGHFGDSLKKTRVVRVKNESIY